VFFDNLQVVHKPGPITEENHYYPFGLVMNGISSKGLNGVSENKKKYNGIEQNSDFELNIYDAYFRNIDPQIGKWWQVDPKIDGQEMWSPYNAMSDNPILHSDPLGDTSILSNQFKTLKQGWDDFNQGKGTAYKSLELFNRTFNPLTDIYHSFTGKDFITGEKVSRAEGLLGLGLMVVGGKAEMAAAKTIASQAVEGGVNAAKGGSKYLYHYTSEAAAQSISKTGLRTGKDGFLYLTNKSRLSPLQAQIELALPANRALPTSILRIDVSGLSPSIIRRVQGNLPSMGAGGGTEILFNQNILANRIKIFK
jgi:RHS repeat-associated protein